MMERKDKRFIDINTLSTAEIAARTWLSIKDVIKATTLSESAIYSYVATGDFPKPYKGVNAAWDVGDVNGWLLSLTNTWESSAKFKPVTWSAIKTLFDKFVFLSNADIASMLDADVKDVSVLTKLMEKAGELLSHKNTKGKSKKLYCKFNKAELAKQQ